MERRPRAHALTALRRLMTCAMTCALLSLTLASAPALAQQGAAKAAPDKADGKHDHSHDHKADAAPDKPAAKAAPPDQAPTDDLLKQADAIAARVATIRGLPLKQPIKKGVYQREQLRAKLIRELEAEITDAEIAYEGIVFKQLGLLPPTLDYKKVFLDVLTEQIAGFYDHKTHELYIMQGIPEALVRATMAHEIYHGVQDQRFDLKALFAPFSARENSDFQLARSALVEGDAMIVTYDFFLYDEGKLPSKGATSIADSAALQKFLASMTLGQLDKLAAMFGGADPDHKQTGALGKAPAMIQDVLAFPYLYGARFVATLRHGRTWEQVNAVYQKPPLSTEHILHPERYMRGDDPVLLPFDPSAALPGGYAKIYDNVLGELQIFLWLREHLRVRHKRDVPGRSDPAAAAEGWGGDHLLAYRNAAGEAVIVHLSVWDTTRDAAEYYAAVREVTERRDPKLRYHATRAEGAQATCFVQGQGAAARSSYVEQWGDMVLYIENAPRLPGKPEAAQPVYAMRDAAWRTVKRVPIADELRRRAALASQKQPAAAPLPRVKDGKVQPTTRPPATKTP